jgi:hypothetical protein
MGVEM